MKPFFPHALPLALMTLALTGCGGDDSSSDAADDNSGSPVSYSGLTTKDLTYSGAESDATVSSSNYADIAESVHLIALSERNSVYINNIAPDGIGINSAQDSAAISVDTLISMYKALIKETTISPEKQSAQQSGLQAMASSSEYPETAQEFSTAITGSCGGSAVISGSTSEINNDDDETLIYEDIGDYMFTATMSDLCYYYTMDDDSEIMITANGTLSYYDYQALTDNEAANIYSRDEKTTITSDLKMVTGSATFLMASAYSYHRSYDRTEDDTTGDIQYDPDTFIYENKEAYAISSAGGTGYYTNVAGSHVNPDDYSNLIYEDAQELLEINGQVHRYSAERYSNGNIEIEAYLPDYGFVSAEGTALVLCDDASGFQSGTMEVNIDDTTSTAEIEINYTSCSEATVTYTADSTTTVMQQGE
ncbi:MAG: hypothetical protein KYX62_03865 [Pseudomonadota bacterium]|nr:hypothetical protein [Pseudomonadota bacterium]